VVSIIVSAVLALKVFARVGSWKGLHDGRNEDASDEDISVADETDEHYVSLFLSFVLFSIKKDLIVAWLVTDTVSFFQFTFTS
jgi:hypothetical protein